MMRHKLMAFLVLVAGIMFGASGVKAQGTMPGDANGDCRVGTCATEPVMSLSVALADPAGVCALNLMDQEGIVELPGQIGELVNLEELHLGGTAIRQLPGEIGGLKKLRVLDVMDVPVQELPAAIGDLENLRVLDLSDTGLTSFPEAILRLKNLEELNLAFVNVGQVPDSISRLTGVQISDSEKMRLRKLLPNTTILGL